MAEKNNPPAKASYVPQDSMFLWWLTDPAAPRLIGELSLVDKARGVALRYSETWLKSGTALSEDLPLQARLFVPEVQDSAVGAVDDARPDRWGERVIRALDKPKRLSLLEYLYFAGDNRFGALGVSLMPEAYSPSPTASLPMISEVARIHDIVRKVAAGEAVEERERRLVSPGRTMGGAKPKSLVQIDGAEWVLKFADEYDHDWPLIEHATMAMGRLCGIDMCETRAVPFARNRTAIAVRRFDRHAGGARRHCISAGVALRAAGEAEGYPELAGVFRRLLGAETQAAARAQLFRRMVFNILVDNSDDHERNHALVLNDAGDTGDAGYVLSPAYDVVPAMQNLRYQALRVGSEQSDATLHNAMTECSAFGLTKDQAAGVVREVCAVVGDWRSLMAGQGVGKRDLAALEPFLEGDKAAMRAEFSGR